MVGFSIQIFLPDGDPDGLRVVTKSHWTGTALMARRSTLKEHLSRPEFGRSGVHVLLGPPETEFSKRQIYIGESDDLATRISTHAKKKEFWSEVVVFTKTDDSLNKAHIKYLESRLVKLASETGRAELDNSTNPEARSLTE